MKPDVDNVSKEDRIRSVRQAVFHPTNSGVESICYLMGYKDGIYHVRSAPQEWTDKEAYLMGYRDGEGDSVEVLE